jgi:hypothetical protein
MTIVEMLGGPVPLFSHERQVYRPGGLRRVEHTWSLVWLRRRLTITFSGNERDRG